MPPWEWGATVEASDVAEDDVEVLSLPGSQLVLATMDEHTLVLDCLVPGVDDPTDALIPQVPFTVRAHLPHGAGPIRIPPTIQDWVDTGAPTDVVFRLRGPLSLVVLRGEHSEIVFELESRARDTRRPPRRC